VTPGPSIALEANSSYWFAAYSLFKSNNTGCGVGFGFLLPTSPTAFGATTSVPINDTNSIQTLIHYGADIGAATSGVGTVARPYFAQTEGMIVTGANAGNLVLRVKSETSAGITLMAGSSLKVEKLT